MTRRPRRYLDPECAAEFLDELGGGVVEDAGEVGQVVEEAYADLIARTIAATPVPAPGNPRGAARALAALRLVPARCRRGRPLILAGRVLAAALLAVAVLHSGAGAALIADTLAGIVTWLAFTVRGDLASPPGR